MSNYKHYPVEYRSLFSEKAEQHNRLLYRSNFVGGTMSYMKLIKLLYIVDRQALISWGRPITYDCYMSLKLLHYAPLPNSPLADT